MTIGGMSITTKAVTGDGFGTPAHFDKEDFGGYSWLIFYRLGSDEAEVIGGAFYFPEFGMRFQPGRCSAMLLNTQGVEHGTTQVGWGRKSCSYSSLCKQPVCHF